MAKTGVNPTGISTLVLGDVGSGKTRYLADRARSLVADGASTSDIVMFCAAPQAAWNARRQLAEAGFADVRVTTPRELAFSLLDNQDARAFTGRDGRMLLPFEEDFLFEDLGTSGMKRRREKEMLRFFARNFSEMADESDWLLEGEETYMLGLVRECLGSIGGMLECEVSAFAVRWLTRSADALADAAVAHVLADDYQLYSRASQLLVNLVAGCSIAVTADPHISEAVFDSYPYANGPREFVQANPDAQVTRLSACCRSKVAADMTSALLGDAGMADDDRLEDLSELVNGEGERRVGHEPVSFLVRGSFEEREFPSPEDELRGIADIVADALRSGVEPSDVCIAHPGGRWGREVVRALPKLGVSITTIERGELIRCDVRDPLGSAGARMFSLLALLANGGDTVSMRSLCGFGDGLAGSFGFAALREYASQQGMPLSAVLDAAACGAQELSRSLPGQAASVISAYTRSLDSINRCRGLNGRALVDALADEVASATGKKHAALVQGFTRLVGSVSDGEDASELFARAYGRLRAPDLNDAQAVRVLDMRDMVGQNPRLLVLTGFVNGIMPPRVFFDRSALLEKELQEIWREGAHRAYACVGKAGERFIATRFTRISPEGAEMLELEVDRVRYEDGRRVCVVGASEFLDVSKGCANRTAHQRMVG